MDESVHNEDLLMRYFDGDLTKGEMQAVENRLQNDEAFREQYTSLRVAVQAIRQFGTLQQVQRVHGEMMKELKEEQSRAKVFPLRRIIRYSLAIAASVAVLLVGIRVYQNAQLSPDHLYNEAFVDYNVAATRGSNDGLSKIEDLYQAKQYSQVTSSVRTLNLSGKDSLLIGLSYLHQQNFSSAITWFNALAASASEYRPDAEFYLSLSYLKHKKYAMALTLLERIYRDSEHLYHQQVSEEMMEKVRKLNEKE